MSDNEKTKRPIVLPKVEPTSITDYYNYDEEIIDYDSLDALSKAINSARRALFQLTEKVNDYETQEMIAKVAYERQHARMFLASTKKTAAEKKLHADIYCENLENDYLVLGQVKNELVRASHTLRLELQTLQAVGNNLRQQLKV